VKDEIVILDKYLLYNFDAMLVIEVLILTEIHILHKKVEVNIARHNDIQR
jgi:hypothetical protein